MPCTAEQTVFKFDELSPEAQARAIENSRDWNTDHDWWDCVYEDAVTCAEYLGITIDTHAVRLNNEKTRSDPCIYFRGFSSQGDGACFSGSYYHDPESRAKLAAHCSDETLATIVDELAILQMTVKLTCGETVRAKITTSRSYCHSWTMSVDVECDDDDVDLQDAEQQLTALMRRFADWIYEQLEAEYDYLTSDEAIKEALADQKFDEDGALI